MRSVADALRAQDRERMRALTASERVAHALTLGRLGIETFRHAQATSLPAPDARRLVERRRQASRRPSACLRALAS